MKKRILITGATGAVGTALANELTEHGHDVTAIVRPGSRRLDRLAQNPRLETAACSLRDIRKLAGMLQGRRYDIFYHLAWDYSRDHMNTAMHLNNAACTLEAVHAAKETGCRVFIGAGSQAEYGRAEGKISERSHTAPETAYGISKFAAGRLAEIECQKLGIRYVWPRIFSVYGPGDADTTMVMTLIRQLLEQKRPSLTLGEQQWDFLYAKDAAAALRLLGETETCSGIYCVGSGKSKKLQSFIEEIRTLANPGAELGFGEIPYKPGQVMHLEADITKLSQETGFFPKTPFHEGIRQTIEWIKQHPAVLSGFGS